MSISLHQAWPEHLLILTKLNKSYIRPLDKDILIRLNKVEAVNSVRELRNIMFDTQYDLQDIINKANTARN
jgi:hypothetical protein